MTTSDTSTVLLQTTVSAPDATTGHVRTNVIDANQTETETVQTSAGNLVSKKEIVRIDENTFEETEYDATETPVFKTQTVTEPNGNAVSKKMDAATNAVLEFNIKEVSEDGLVVETKTDPDNNVLEKKVKETSEDGVVIETKLGANN